MNPLPVDLLAALPDGAEPIATRWWASLPESDRRRILGLWDDRLEVCFFSPQSDSTGAVDEWEQIPAVAGGRFVPHDDDGKAEWAPGYFEHLLQHPELVLAYEPSQRTFHIGCTRHPAARTCLETGTVPADFECPLLSQDCPLHPLRSANLRPVGSAGRARSLP